MKAFLNNIIPEIQRFSKNVDSLTLLTNHHWVSLGEIEDGKNVYIFRRNNTLLVAKNGLINKGSWEYLGNESILIETEGNAFLLKHSFIDDDILMLKLDGSEGYVHFVNETKFGREINSIRDVIIFLEGKYTKTPSVSQPEYKPVDPVDKTYVPNFSEESPIKSNNIFFGDYDIIKITFDDCITGEILRGHSSGRYFIYDSVNGRRYADTKHECIHKLYRSIKFKQ